jgi:hypothetical protein
MGQDSDERLLVDAAQRDPSRFGDLYERNFYRGMPSLLAE